MKNLQTFESFTESAALQEGEFWRLPSKVIGNDLYTANKMFASMYSSLEKGDDLNMNSLESLIDILSKIKKQAKKFKSAEDVPAAYESL